MAGHSKWSKVKHQKAVTDVIKGKQFTKASRAITTAVREGGGISDPERNVKLRLAIEQARSVNMPRENIERAIAKASGDKTEIVESLTYEAYGPYGSAFIIECLTENRNRTAASVKSILQHHHGTIAAPGAVLFQFSHLALCVVAVSGRVTHDAVFEAAIAARAKDVYNQEQAVEVTAEPAVLHGLRQSLLDSGLTVVSSEITYIPLQPLALTETEKKEVEEIVVRLEELDDVQSVYTNID